MTPDDIARHFTRPDGSYLFARWGRPLAPVVFGLADESLPVVKGALQAVAALAGHPVADTDPETGANLMIFFLRDWRELTDAPAVAQLIPDAEALVERLDAGAAHQYRLFRFDQAGAIRAAFVFLRMDAALAEIPAETLALAEAVQIALVWADAAFGDRSPLAKSADGTVILRPEIARLIRAAYDPGLPDAARDASHALRLFARMEATA